MIAGRSGGSGEVIEHKLYTEVITGNQTWRAPKARDNKYHVMVFGGGGAGSYIINYGYWEDRINFINAIGGGGGGGNLNQSDITLPMGTSIPVTVGTGGIIDPVAISYGEWAREFSLQRGLNGGTSTFGQYISATGGEGSGCDATPSYPFIAGGNGGTGGGMSTALYTWVLNRAGNGYYGGGGGAGGATSSFHSNYQYGGNGGTGGIWGGGGGSGGINDAKAGGGYGGRGGNDGRNRISARPGIDTMGNYAVYNDGQGRYFFGSGLAGNAYPYVGPPRSSAGAGGGGYGGRGGHAISKETFINKRNYNTIEDFYGGGGGGGGYGGNGGNGTVLNTIYNWKNSSHEMRGQPLKISAGGGGGGWGNDGSDGGMGGGGGGGYGPLGYGHGGDGVQGRENGKAGCVIIQWYG